ncbi:MAG: hypothetical protein J0L97_01395 [Alphaproteobacteria bacterium]|nr:hypothetical protein [Alphaproteobacteria bacterium]
MPAATADKVVQKSFLPTLSPAGERHPVTASLRSAPEKGKWLGYLPVEGAATGDVLLTTPEGEPLMVLAHIENGRVAQFLSDQPWLWARGYDGGGPHLQLLRHLVHWLVREPELEEERLSAEVKPTPEGSFILKVTRHSIKETLPASVTVTAPDSVSSQHPLTLSGPGQAEALLPVKQPGLYHISDGEISREVVVGDGNSKEFVEVVATEKKLASMTRASHGSFHWLESGAPRLRRVESGSMASGHGWIGLPRRNAGTVTGVQAEPLLHPLFSAALILTLLAWAWHREAR